jgi:hypothetical protein
MENNNNNDDDDDELKLSESTLKALTEFYAEKSQFDEEFSINKEKLVEEDWVRKIKK